MVVINKVYCRISAASNISDNVTNISEVPQRGIWAKAIAEARYALLLEVAYSLSKDVYYPINYLIHLFGFEMTNSVEDDVSICCKYAVWSRITPLPKSSSFKFIVVN